MIVDLKQVSLGRDVVEDALDWSRRNSDQAEILDDLADDEITAASDTLMTLLAGAPAHIAIRMERQLFDDPMNTTPQGFGTVDRIDRIGARLLEHAGIDPLVLVWLSTVTRNYCPLSSKDENIIEMGTKAIGENSETSVALGMDAIWDCSGAVAVRTLPDTIAATARGRPLSEMISHPVLDGMPLVVTDVEDTGSGWRWLKTDAVLEPVTTEELRELSWLTSQRRRDDAA